MLNNKNCLTISTVLQLILLVRWAQSWNYCLNASFHCEESNTRHFSCTGELASLAHLHKATFVDFLPITPRVRDLFLELHNEFRNAIASGTEQNNANKEKFPAASRLREYRWDRELEYIAHMHAMHCCSEPTKCHCSTKFKNVGQNLAFTSSASKLAHNKIINGSIQGYFSEKNLMELPISLTEKFLKDKHSSAAHFTTILQDRSHRLGCALAYCKGCEEGEFCYYMTCQYDFTNMENIPVYLSGKPTSACGDWQSKQSKSYVNLCANNGKDFPQH